jgi:hypothetical protein
MNNSSRCISLCLASLSAILLFASLPTFAAPHLTGTYKITESTDLGTEIRLAVQLNLVNVGESAVTVSHVGLGSFSAHGQLVNFSPNVVIQAHSDAQVTLQFVISKTDFAAWSIGPHQQFFISIRPTGNKVMQVNVPLLRTKE